MNSKSILLIIAGLLIAIGIFKPNLSNILNISKPDNIVVVDDIKLDKPSGSLMDKAKDVIKALSVDSDRKSDGKRLASLYNDIADLVALDGENEVIKNTEEIRQANRLAGLMLQLDIKGKYEDLPEAAQSLLLTAIGDDSALLNKDLREKAVEGFRALAWACNEGSK